MAAGSHDTHRVAALDNLRVFAMLLGLVTHGVLPYTATGVIGFPIRDASRSVLADACYFAVHDFRMQLFFLLSGFAAAGLAARRGVGALLANRGSRVAVPLALAVVALGPVLHVVFAGHVAERGVAWDAGAAGGWIAPNFHLWFLYYLLLCCAPLTVLLAASDRLPASLVRGFDAAVRWLVGSTWTVPLAAVVAVPVLWDMPAWLIDTPKGWVPDLTIYAYYLGFFLAGAALFRHRDRLANVGRRWILQLSVANVIVLPVMLAMTVSGNWAEDEAHGLMPAWLVAWKAAAIVLGGLYTGLSIAGLLGLFQRFAGGTSPVRRYLAGASYWCYLAGFPVQAVLQAWLAPYAIPIVVEFLLVNVVTFGVLLVTYELCVRRSWVGVVLNGRRTEQRPEPVVVAARVPVRVRPVALPNVVATARVPVQVVPPTAATSRRTTTAQPEVVNARP